MEEHVAVDYTQQGLDNQGRSPIRRLGRGLNALLGGGQDEAHPEDHRYDPQIDPNEIHVDLIEPNPFQPRREFDADALSELAGSIAQHGLLQPILVRPYNGQYQIIAGERRWQAAKKAGFETVTVRVLELEDQDAVEAAMEENLKRRDLNPLEKAQAFSDYLDRWNCTVEELAGRLSMTRTNVSNYMRLLGLPEAVKKALLNSSISAGHARAMLTLEEHEQLDLCKQVVNDSLSVRKTEQAVREILASRPVEGEEDLPCVEDIEPAVVDVEPPVVDDPPEECADVLPFEQQIEGIDEHVTNHVRSLEQQLRDHLGAKVEIKLKDRESGKIVIAFDSNDQFEQILGTLRAAA